MPRPSGRGRPGTVVFPSQWAVDGAAVVAGTLASTVTVGPAHGTSGWNPVSEQTETQPAVPVYEGPAGIAPASDNDREVVAGGDDVSVRVYEVTLDAQHAGADLVTSDHVVRVTACPDPLLAGRTLDVTTVELGDRRFSRMLLATLND